MPVYETMSDVEMENETVARIEAAYGIILLPYKPPLEPGVDRRCDRVWVNCRGHIDAYVELKRRKVSYWYPYPTVSWGQKKFERVLRCGSWREPKHFFVPILNGQVWDYIFNPNDAARFIVDRGGRTDRGDPRDQELMVHIPVDLFIRIL